MASREQGALGCGPSPTEGNGGRTTVEESAEPALEVRPVTLTSADIAVRTARGEDVRPLARSLMAGLAGLGGALAIDWLIPNGNTWANLGAALAGTGTIGGVVSAAALACTAALLYTYGQIRRFLALPSPAGGVAWTLALWLVTGPLLLVRATWLAPDPTAVRATLGAAWLLVAETTMGVLCLGLAIGWLCVRRAGDV